MRLKLALGLTLALVPSAAFAHTGAGDAHDLIHGFMHPMGGVDHLLAMVAVGVFAVALGGRALYAVPAAFVGMMVAGFLLGIAGVQLPFMELVIGASSVVIAGAALFGRSMKVAAASALVGVFAVFHGVAHGAELPLGASGWEFALGFVVATAALHLAGIGATLAAIRLSGRSATSAKR